MTLLPRFRVLLGLTRERAAQVVGVSAPTYRRLEEGRHLRAEQAYSLLEKDPDLLAWFSRGDWSISPGAIFAAFIQDPTLDYLVSFQNDLPRVGKHLAIPGQSVKANGQWYPVESVDVVREIVYQPGGIPSSIVTDVQ